MPRRRRHRVEGYEIVVPSAARATNSNTSALGGWSRSSSGAVSKLDCTAASGTPTLTVFIEDSPDGTAWTVRDTYPAKTGISNETRALPANMDNFQRVRWTITGGTPSITFSVQFAASTTLL
ncbi:MAG TPA: hypothetical protein VK595_05975 [Vicinamibacterales bacterium]|nr:hypothetical protein [Vicinamibacterales bacterium]